MCPTSTSFTPSAEFIVGPAHRFRIEGRSLRFGPRNDEIASFRDGQWCSDGRTFTVLESVSPTLLRFEGGKLSRAEIRGPYPAIQVVAGVLRHGPGEHQVLAVFVEETQTWRVSGGKHATTVVLSPAAVAEEDSDDEFTADDFAQSAKSEGRASVSSAALAAGKTDRARWW